MTIMICLQYVICWQEANYVGLRLTHVDVVVVVDGDVVVVVEDDVDVVVDDVDVVVDVVVDDDDDDDDVDVVVVIVVVGNQSFKSVDSRC